MIILKLTYIINITVPTTINSFVALNQSSCPCQHISINCHKKENYLCVDHCNIILANGYWLIGVYCPLFHSVVRFGRIYWTPFCI